MKIQKMAGFEFNKSLFFAYFEDSTLKIYGGKLN
jgi:hypothetical protein